MTDQITSEPTSLVEAFKEMAACAQDHPAAEPWMYKFADLILAKLSLPSPPVSGEAVDLRPMLDWYVKATGDIGDDYLNDDGWDDLHEIIGTIGSALGVEESDDCVPLLYPAPVTNEPV